VFVYYFLTENEINREKRKYGETRTGYERALLTDAGGGLSPLP
jgi:hypothetical protein